MLKFNVFNFRFYRFIQNGLFVDYYLKKIVEIFVRNIFVYTSQFFGEKYIVEYLTKKVVSNVTFQSSKLLEFIKFSYFVYFIQLLSFFFYFLTFFIVCLAIL